MIDEQRPMSPNGRPPPAVTITVEQHPQGQQIHVTHALQDGWGAAVALLIQALAIAHQQHGQELKAKPTPPPLIMPATMHPRLPPEQR